MFFLLTVVDRDVAWNQIKSITGFGPGGSKSNSLFWAASRNPPPPNYNGSAHGLDIKGIVKQACSANSACDAVGTSHSFQNILLLYVIHKIVSISMKLTVYIFDNSFC